jgi:hypothetical protein
MYVWSDARRIEKLRYIHRNPVKRGLVGVRRIGRGAVFGITFLAPGGVVEIESQWTARRRERMGSVVGMESQNPRPFGFAQGRLCRSKCDKDGAPSIVYE